MSRRLDARGPGFEAQFHALLNTKREQKDDVAQTAREIVADVRARGDVALLELTSRLDRFPLTLDALRLTDAEIGAAHSACNGQALAALDVAATRIELYHR